MDRELTIAAGAVPLVLAEDFHDRALTAGSITPAEDQRNLAALTALVRQGDFACLYSLIVQDGIPRLTAISACVRPSGLGGIGWSAEAAVPEGSNESSPLS